MPPASSPLGSMRPCREEPPSAQPRSTLSVVLDGKAPIRAIWLEVSPAECRCCLLLGLATSALAPRTSSTASTLPSILAMAPLAAISLATDHTPDPAMGVGRGSKTPPSASAIKVRSRSAAWPPARLAFCPLGPPPLSTDYQRMKGRAVRLPFDFTDEGIWATDGDDPSAGYAFFANGGIFNLTSKGPQWTKRGRIDNRHTLSRPFATYFFDPFPTAIFKTQASTAPSLIRTVPTRNFGYYGEPK